MADKAAHKRTARALAAGKSPLGGEYGKASAKASGKLWPASDSKPTKLTRFGTRGGGNGAAVSSKVVPDRSGFKTIDNRSKHFSAGVAATQPSAGIPRAQASAREWGGMTPGADSFMAKAVRGGTGPSPAALPASKGKPKRTSAEGNAMAGYNGVRGRRGASWEMASEKTRSTWRRMTAS